MPELPEVETIRRGLEKYLLGQVIESVEVREAKVFRGHAVTLAGRGVLNVRRRAKVLIIELSGGISLLIHLKMTGQLVYQSATESVKVVGGHPQAAYNQPMPHKHTHVIFYFHGGGRLFFNDLRKFGWIRVVPTERAETDSPLATFGPEPLARDFTVEVLKQRFLAYPQRRIFAALLDQSLVAGIGNIYANESLYEAGIHPERRVITLKNQEWVKLWRAIRRVLKTGLRYGGTSDSTYINVEGKRGDYLKHAHVYHRQTAQPCGHTIVRQKIGSRTAHFCPIDQT